MTFNDSRVEENADQNTGHRKRLRPRLQSNQSSDSLKRRTDGLYDAARGMAAHQEHLQILSAMKRQEVGEAVMLVRRHIRNGKQNVLADLRQREAMRGAQSNGSSLIE